MQLLESHQFDSRNYFLTKKPGTHQECQVPINKPNQ